jgi:hypothetical protein
MQLDALRGLRGGVDGSAEVAVGGGEAVNGLDGRGGGHDDAVSAAA